MVPPARGGGAGGGVRDAAENGEVEAAMALMYPLMVKQVRDEGWGHPHGNAGLAEVQDGVEGGEGRRAGVGKGRGGGVVGGVAVASGQCRVLSRADMVHYVDVRGSWDWHECECCFDRAVGFRAQRALNIVCLAEFHKFLNTRQHSSTPLVPSPPPTPAILAYSLKVPMKTLQGMRGAPRELVFGSKCLVAPVCCAEGMLLEWFAEPRVGVLMDLAGVRSRLPSIMAAEGSVALAPAVAACSPAGSWSSRWAAYRRAASFAALLVVVATRPRVVSLWRCFMLSHKRAFPAIAVALGAGRQAEKDTFASALVQMLGVKDSADLQQGFGFHMQHLLSGGLEKVHGEGQGGTGVAGAREVNSGGSREEQGDAMQRLMRLLSMVHEGESEGAGRGSREAPRCAAGDDKGGNWKEHLKGPVWERYVDGIAWILKHGGGEEKEFRCSHCSEGSSSGGKDSSSSSSSDLQQKEIAKSMYVSGVSATDFALAVTAVLSRPAHYHEGETFIFNGNNSSKIRVEDAAIEAARGRLRREMNERKAECRAGGTGGVVASASKAAPPCDLGRVPVNTNPVVAAFTYRVARLLEWARVYGSDSTSGKGCPSSAPQCKVRPIRHPLRDLPSLLLRAGAIPKPVDEAAFSLEWEEWAEGDEAAMRFPDDPSARCYGMGVVEGSGTAGKGGRGGKGLGRHKAGRGRRKRGSGTGGGSRGCGAEQRGETEVNVEKRPIVRCEADAEFLVEAASGMLKPPACAQCNDCFSGYFNSLPFLTVITTFAYQPASTLLNRFLSVHPPHSIAFTEVVKLLGLPPFPKEVPPYVNLPVVQARVEEMPILFLLLIAMYWPSEVLDDGEKETGDRRDEAEAGERRKAEQAGRDETAGGGGGSEEEDRGEVWEEVRAWRYAATLAWPSTMRMSVRAPNADAMRAGLSDSCKGRKVAAAAGRGGMQPNAIDLGWFSKTLLAACDPRFREDKTGHGGAAGSSSAGSSVDKGGGSSSSSSSNCEVSDKKGELRAYLKPWPGGVNLVASLREMLLGRPCYRLPTPAAPKVAAAPGVPSNAVHVDQAASPTRSSSSAAPGAPGTGRVCSAPGCGGAEGGGVRLKACTGCGKAAYCDRNCQKAHWPSHKVACKAKASSKVSGKGSGNVSSK